MPSFLDWCFALVEKYYPKDAVTEQLIADPLPTHPIAQIQADLSGNVRPLADIEHEYIATAILLCKGDKLLAAKKLGIGKTTLYRKLKEWKAIESSPTSADTR